MKNQNIFRRKCHFMNIDFALYFINLFLNIGKINLESKTFSVCKKIALIDL